MSRATAILLLLLAAALEAGGDAQGRTPQESVKMAVFQTAAQLLRAVDGSLDHCCHIPPS
jgi:hypothetical protein